MINRRLVEERLEMIAGLLEKLELLAQTLEAEFLADWVKPTLTESCLRRSLEAVLNQKKAAPSPWLQARG